ncbi:hypothetical protein BH11PLA2_BH11PLA2_01810 [soil metagenome]
MKPKAKQKKAGAKPRPRAKRKPTAKMVLKGTPQSRRKPKSKPVPPRGWWQHNIRRWLPIIAGIWEYFHGKPK